MKLKKSKEDVLQDIRWNAHAAFVNHLQNHTYNGSLPVDTSRLSAALADSISNAIESAFNTLIDNQYTDEDFERDLTLRE